MPAPESDRVQINDFFSDEELIKYGLEEDVWYVTPSCIHPKHPANSVKGMLTFRFYLTK